VHRTPLASKHAVRLQPDEPAVCGSGFTVFVEANVVLRNVVWWLMLGLTNFAGVLVVVDIVQRIGQSSFSECLPSFALALLVGAIDMLAIYIELTRRAT
jgi:hypothetical protein